MIPANTDPLLTLLKKANTPTPVTLGSSLRLVGDQQAGLTRVFGNTGNRKKWTLNVWTKMSSRWGVSNLFMAKNESGTLGEFIHKLHSNTFQFIDFSATELSSYYTYYGATDTTAWTNWHIMYDSDQPLIEDRLRIIKNNSVWRLDTINKLDAGRLSYINSDMVHQIGGSFVAANGATTSFDGYLYRFAFVDGQALEPKLFVTYSSRGKLIPADKNSVASIVNSGGDNSFFLTFDDSSGSLGKDYSNKGNDWDLVNLSFDGEDSAIARDDPENNLCTLNTFFSSQMLFNNGFVSPRVPVYYKGDTVWNINPFNLERKEWITGTVTITDYRSGYWEVKGTDYFWGAGVVDPGSVINVSSKHDMMDFIGCGITAEGEGVKDGVFVGTYSQAFSQNDVLGFYCDGNARSLKIFRNNVLVKELLDIPRNCVPIIWSAKSYQATPLSKVFVNFGQQPFKNAIYQSSTLSNNDPFVNYRVNSFEDRVYYAQGSPYGGVSIEDHVVIGRNKIREPYLEIYGQQNTGTPGINLWVQSSGSVLNSFSDWGSIPYDIPSGSNYHYYCMGVAPEKGITFGRINVEHGQDTLVNDITDLSDRKVIIIKIEMSENSLMGSGVKGDWYMYHPDLPAGHLLILNKDEPSKPLDHIKDVTSTTFTIGPGLPSGAYSWYVFTETPGFIELGKYKTTGETYGTGPFFPNIIGKFGIFKIINNQNDPKSFVSPTGFWSDYQGNVAYTYFLQNKLKDYWASDNENRVLSLNAGVLSTGIFNSNYYEHINDTNVGLDGVYLLIGSPSALNVTP